MSEEEEDLRDIFTDPESESDFDLGDDDVWEGAGTGRVPRDTSKAEKIPEDVKELLSQAQQSFAAGHHDAAITLCEEAVKIDGNIRQTYNLLVSIYEDKGDERSAITAKFLAATLNKGDIHDWMDLVERAVQLGKFEDAAVALQQVSNIKPDDWELRWRRAKIHTELGQHSKALSIYNRLRRNYFPNIDEITRVLIIRDISGSLKALGRHQDALQMYKQIYDANMTANDTEEVEVLFDLTSIEEYASLLIRNRMWRQTINVIKAGFRYCSNRLDETYWDDLDNDVEYDYERREVINADVAKISPDPSLYVLPIEFRVMLLECRLKLYIATGNSSHLEEAFAHVPYIEEELRCAISEGLADRHIIRVIWVVADSFFEAKEYSTARGFYDDLSGLKVTPDEFTKSMIQVAKCFNLLKSPKNAITLYQNALDKQPDNIEALIGLAESYQEIGQKAKSKDLISKAVHLRARELDIGDGQIIAPREFEAPSSAANTAMDESTDPALFAVDSHFNTKKQNDAAAKALFEQSQSQLATDAFIELDRFSEGLEKGNEVAAAEWIRNATMLIQIFRSNRKFFPSDRNKQFIANTSALSNPNLNIDERLALGRVGAADDDGEEEESLFKFKGKTFDTWFEIFMRTALARAFYDKIDTAYMIIRTGKMSNIFHVDPEREMTMDLVQLSCAYHARDFQMVSEVVRHLYSKNQFNDEILLMYNALLPSSQAAVEVFGSANNQKYVLRNIKAMDAAVNQKEVKGAAKLTTDTVHESPQLRLLYAQIMLMGPSYTPALTYLMAALHSLPKDPVVLLSLAVVCMQRSLQRVTPNRHLQILQGLSFMQDYFAVRDRNDGELQERSYNMGRFYHALGLFSLAVPFYEQAIEYEIDAEFDLRREAAYNLHLIYAISGNMRLARKVIDEYLEI